MLTTTDEDGRCTDDARTPARLLYYKLTLSAFGSGELIINERTNGPVNAHLRPEIYTTRMVIYMYITPEQPLEAISFLNHKDSVHLPIYCKFCPNNFPHSNAWAT